MIHLHPPFHLSQKPFHSLDLGRPVLNKTLFKITHLYLYFFLIYPKLVCPLQRGKFQGNGHAVPKSFGRYNEHPV